MHRIGGIEKDYDTGNISYEPENHHRMTERAPPRSTASRTTSAADGRAGHTKRPLAVVGWGSTYGPISRAVEPAAPGGTRRGAHPPAPHLAAAGEPGRPAERLDQVIVPEMNTASW